MKKKDTMNTLKDIDNQNVPSYESWLLRGDRTEDRAVQT